MATDSAAIGTPRPFYTISELKIQRLCHRTPFSFEILIIKFIEPKQIITYLFNFLHCLAETEKEVLSKKHSKWFVDFNLFLTSGLVHPYHLDESISSFRGFW